MSTIAERIKFIRNERNLIQKEVADGCEIALRSFKYYESGEREPSASTIVRLCQYFNISADYLLGLSDNPEINK